MRHNHATTTRSTRAAIQKSKASVRTLSKRYGVNPKTVVKWRRRDYVHDAPKGPKTARSTVLSKAEEAVAVLFRKHTSLSLDRCLSVLQPTIPHLTRSSLHRLFERHGVGRLQRKNNSKDPREANPAGHFRIDVLEVSSDEVRLWMFVAVDQATHFTFARLYGSVTARSTGAFLRQLIEAVPYTIRAVFSQNDSEFTVSRSESSAGRDRHALRSSHAGVGLFARACAKHDIHHEIVSSCPLRANVKTESINRVSAEKAKTSSSRRRDGSESIVPARIKMIRAAEKLFGTRGIGSVSLREIGAAAGQRNTSAVQYHFKSKAGLIQEILVYRTEEMEGPRKKLLHEAERRGRLTDIRTLMEALWLPQIDIIDEDGRHSYAAFLMQHYNARRLTEDSGGVVQMWPTLKRIFALLLQSLSHLPPDVANVRIRVCGMMFLHLLVRIDSGAVPSTLNFSELLDDRIKMMTAALCAPFNQ